MKLLLKNYLYEAIDPLDNPNFRAWFGSSKVIDKDGTPLILYHGTTNDFSNFNMSYAREGNMGKGFYFTNSSEDAGGNYGCELGPDALNHRASYVDSEEWGIADKLSKLELDDLDDPSIVKGYTKQELDEIRNILNSEDRDFDEVSKKVAERWFDEKYRKNCGNIMPVYLRMQNPFITSEEFGEYECEEVDPDDEDSYPDPTGRTLELLETFQRYGLEFKFENYGCGDTINNSDIFGMLEEEPNADIAADYEGGAGELRKDIIQVLGYDGVIDTGVSKKFPGMELDNHATHYIVYDPRQIKSIHNKGEFSDVAHDITLEENDSPENNTISMNELYPEGIPRDELLSEYIYPNEMDNKFPITQLTPIELNQLVHNGESIIKLFKYAKKEQKDTVNYYIKLKGELTRDPIVVMGNQLLDGFHRVVAAIKTNTPLNAVDISED